MESFAKVFESNCLLDGILAEFSQSDLLQVLSRSESNSVSREEGQRADLL